jgi:hypothetical protein
MIPAAARESSARRMVETRRFFARFRAARLVSCSTS